DIDPPGFDSLASLMAGAGTMKTNQVLRLVTPPQKSGSVSTKRSKPPTAGTAQNARQLEEARQAKVAAAKGSLQDAKRLLTETRAGAQRLENALKKADTEAKRAETELKQAEKHMREAEERFKRAKTASQFAAQRRQTISAEKEEAADAVEDAQRNVEEASEE